MLFEILRQVNCAIGEADKLADPYSFLTVSQTTTVKKLLFLRFAIVNPNF